MLHRLGQRLRISAWFCRFGECFCGLSLSFQKLRDKDLVLVKCGGVLTGGGVSPALLRLHLSVLDAVFGDGTQVIRPVTPGHPHAAGHHLVHTHPSGRTRRT